jgi:hypothetical protein
MIVTLERQTDNDLDSLLLEPLERWLASDPTELDPTRPDDFELSAQDPAWSQ